MLADERFAEKTMDERGKNNKSKVGEWSGDGVGYRVVWIAWVIVTINRVSTETFRSRVAHCQGMSANPVLSGRSIPRRTAELNVTFET